MSDIPDPFLLCSTGVATPVVMLSVKEAAAHFKVAVSSVHRWITRGTKVGGHHIRLRHVRRGQRIFVPQEALDEFEQACTEAGSLEGDRVTPPSKSEGELRAEYETIDIEARKEGL